jgi:hypothetical protein
LSGDVCVAASAGSTRPQCLNNKIYFVTQLCITELNTVMSTQEDEEEDLFVFNDTIEGHSSVEHSHV